MCHEFLQQKFFSRDVFIAQHVAVTGKMMGYTFLKVTEIHELHKFLTSEGIYAVSKEHIQHEYLQSTKRVLTF